MTEILPPSDRGTVVLSTVHGSHLYGLNHINSDVDYYIVVDGKKDFVEHLIDGPSDVFYVSLTRFLGYCSNGVPQALEALCSPVAYIREDYSPLLGGYRVGTQPAQERYRRTIRNFSSSEDFKRRRHGYRLCLNLYQAVRLGRVRPTLTSEEVRTVNNLVESHTSEQLEYFLSRAILGTYPFIW